MTLKLTIQLSLISMALLVHLAFACTEEEPGDVKEENFIKESELVTPQTKVLEH